MTTFDEFIEGVVIDTIALLKIDAEGSELEIFREGAKYLIKKLLQSTLILMK